MKQGMRMRTLTTAVLGMVLLAAGSSAWAATLFWDAGDTSTTNVVGGNGTWDSATTANWWNTNTWADQVWSGSGGQDIASFGTPAAVISISGTVAVNNISMAYNTKYTITNGTINMMGVHTVAPGGPSGGVAIYSAITGSVGLLVSPGKAYVTLANTNNTYTGGTVFSSASQGHLSINGDGSLGVVPADASGTNLVLDTPDSSEYVFCTGVLHSNRTIALINTCGVFIGSPMTINGRIVSTTALTMLFGQDNGSSVILNSTGNVYQATNIVGRGATLKIGVDNAIPTNTAVINTGTASYSGPTLDLNGHNQTLKGLFCNPGYPIGIVLNSATGTTNALTITGTSAYAGTIQNGGTGNSGVLALTKSGSGTLTLTFTNTYTGPTQISGGTLALSGIGTISSSAVISVSSGAILNVTNLSAFVTASNQTLKGEGLVLGNLTNTPFSTVSPGLVGAGTLTVTGSVSLAGTLLADVDATAGTSDRLAVSGNLALGGASKLILSTNGVFAGGQRFTLASYGGSQSGTFGSVSNLPPKFRIDYGTGNNGVIRLVGPAGGTAIFLR